MVYFINPGQLGDFLVHVCFSWTVVIAVEAD